MKNKIITLSIFVLFIASGIFVIAVYQKYQAISVLSLKREYNAILTSDDDTISIPLYFEKNNSFLSKKEQVESTCISNDSYKYVSYLEDVIKDGTVNYQDKTYYGFSFVISFRSYNDSLSPVFIENGRFTVNYKNGDSMVYSIGNLSLTFANSSAISNSDLYLLKLSSVNNEVKGKETIVGINLTLKNPLSQIITLNSIRLMNKFYDIDFMNYELTTILTKASLLDRTPNYCYETASLKTGSMDLLIGSGTQISIFMPIKYLNGIRYLDSFPIYIDYTVNGVNKRYNIPTFIFVSSNTFYRSNGVLSYEYKYQ